MPAYASCCSIESRRALSSSATTLSGSGIVDQRRAASRGRRRGRRPPARSALPRVSRSRTSTFSSSTVSNSDASLGELVVELGELLLLDRGDRDRDIDGLRPGTRHRPAWTRRSSRRRPTCRRGPRRGPRAWCRDRPGRTCRWPRPPRSSSPSLAAERSMVTKSPSAAARSTGVRVPNRSRRRLRAARRRRRRRPRRRRPRPRGRRTSGSVISGLTSTSAVKLERRRRPRPR